MSIRKGAWALLLGSLVLAELGAGCGSGNSPQPVSPARAQAEGEAGQLWPQGWAQLLATQPQALQQLLDENPDKGWVRLWERDYPAAQKALAGATTPGARLGLARAHLQDAALLGAAYSLALEVEKRYLELWLENSNRLKATPSQDFVTGVVKLRGGDAAAAMTAFQAFRAKAASSEGMLKAVATVLEGQARHQSGDKAGAEKLFKEARSQKDPTALAMLAGVEQELGMSAASGGGAEPDPAYGLRSLLYARVEAGAVPEALAVLERINWRDPDHEESVTLEGGAVSRRYYDPLSLRTLSRLHARQALAALEGLPGEVAFYRAEAEQLLGKKVAAAPATPSSLDKAQLPLFLFSRFPTPADMKREAQRLATGQAGADGLVGRFLSASGTVSAKPDNGEEARRVVVTAQAFLDAGKKSQASASEEGRNTVAGLKVLEVDVATAVREKAQVFASQGRLLEALFLLEHSLDKDNLKLSYQNDPMLFLEITRLYCGLGRYREALNYFYRLVEVRPELWPIHESLGNLSVLGTVDQAGRTGQQD